MESEATLPIVGAVSYRVAGMPARTSLNFT